MTVVSATATFGQQETDVASINDNYTFTNSELVPQYEPRTSNEQETKDGEKTRRDR